MRRTNCCTILLLATLAPIGPAALAEIIVIDYEDLGEGLQGDLLTHRGIAYSELNNVSGVFPSGEPCGQSPADEFIIENAGVFSTDFPAYGSPVKSLTFGPYIPGENLTLGPLSTVTIDLGAPASAASLDLGYYEKDPWGGIVYHLDALSGGQVVASDGFVISDLGSGDDPAIATRSVSGTAFEGWTSMRHAAASTRCRAPSSTISLSPSMIPRPRTTRPGVG
jgi:hypothetical protein